MPTPVSVYEQCIQNVRTVVAGLTLTGISSSHIIAQSVQDEEAGNGPTVPGYPMILIAGGGAEEMAEDAGTNVRNEYVYPVFVGLVDDEAASHATIYRDQWFLWRETIMTAFHNRRLSGITGAVVWKCVVRPQAAIDRNRWFADRFVGGLTVACYAWK